MTYSVQQIRYKVKSLAVPEVGLEPTLLTEFDLKSNAATITPLGHSDAHLPHNEAWARIELAMRDLQSPELPLFYQALSAIPWNYTGNAWRNQPEKLEFSDKKGILMTVF